MIHGTSTGSVLERERVSRAAPGSTVSARSSSTTEEAGGSMLLITDAVGIFELARASTDAILEHMSTCLFGSTRRSLVQQAQNTDVTRR